MSPGCSVLWAAEAPPHLPDCAGPGPRSLDQGGHLLEAEPPGKGWSSQPHEALRPGVRRADHGRVGKRVKWRRTGEVGRWVR